jgi:hypothetical protein
MDETDALKKGNISNSETRSNSSGVYTRNENVKTYIISIPQSHKTPKIKHSALTLIPITIDVDDIHELVKDVEQKTVDIVNKQINIACSSCCTGFKIGKIKWSCFSKNKVKAEVDGNTIKGSVI